MKYIAKNNTNQTDFYKIFSERLNVEALDNMFYIIGADAARRKGYFDISSELASKCTNPLFNELWKNWSDRQNARLKAYNFI